MSLGLGFGCGVLQQPASPSLLSDRHSKKMKNKQTANVSKGFPHIGSDKQIIKNAYATEPGLPVLLCYHCQSHSLADNNLIKENSSRHSL